MKIATGISEEGIRELKKALAQLLADTYATYVKTHNYHWNVTGPRFFSLHKAFEEQYEELAGAVDEIAERVRALGGFVEASFGAFKKLSTIEDETKVLSEDEMLKQLLQDHESICQIARATGDLADKFSDHATVDLIGRRLGIHEKFAWMLRSHL
jgi:starvation-inducible DNA-binding protein